MKIKISNGKLIDGTGTQASQPSEIIVANGEIVRINQTNELVEDGPYDKIIDAKGKTICPGLINAHLHLYMDAGPSPLHNLSEENGHLSLLKTVTRCRRLIDKGITTVRDMGAKDLGIIVLRDAIKKGIVDGPRLIVCGKAMAITGGHAQALANVVDGPDEMRRAVRKLLGSDVDFIKLFATGGFGKPGEQLTNYELTTEEIRAAVQTAHAAGKPVAAHAYGNRGIRNVIDAGVDSIEHATFLDKKSLDRIVEKGIFLVPTLANTYKVSTMGHQMGVPNDMIETAKQVFPEMMKQFSNAYRAGAKIALGTDGGSWLNPHQDIHTELKLRAQAGVKNIDLITMATKTSAECLKVDHEIGTIEVGKKSDIIIIDGDPSRNIEELNNIKLVIKGNIIYELSLLKGIAPIF